MTLQTTYSNGLKNFTDIGKGFQIVHRDDCPDEFERIARLEEIDPLALDRVFGFVTHAAGSKIIPLYNTQRSAILNDRGDIFIDMKSEMIVKTVEVPSVHPLMQNIVDAHFKPVN